MLLSDVRCGKLFGAALREPGWDGRRLRLSPNSSANPPGKSPALPGSLTLPGSLPGSPALSGKPFRRGRGGPDPASVRAREAETPDRGVGPGNSLSGLERTGSSAGAVIYQCISDIVWTGITMAGVLYGWGAAWPRRSGCLDPAMTGLPGRGGIVGGGYCRGWISLGYAGPGGS